MMLRKRFVVPSVILILGMLLSACSLTGPAAAPTVDPLALQATVDAAVAQALQAEALKLTSTAAALPTNTSTFTATVGPTSTATPTLEPTATATLEPTATVSIPTATNTVKPTLQKPTATATAAAYSCSLISTSPTSGTKLNINSDFDAVWKVKNSGTKAWEIGYIDLVYVSGTKMQTMGDIFDVKTAVAQGGELTLTVDMKTPSTAAKYTEAFVLKMEGITMCTLPLNIEAVTP